MNTVEYSFHTAVGTFRVLQMEERKWYAAYKGFSWAGPFTSPDEAAAALASGLAPRAAFDTSALGIPPAVRGWVATT